MPQVTNLKCKLNNALKTAFEELFKRYNESGDRDLLHLATEFEWLREGLELLVNNNDWFTKQSSPAFVKEWLQKFPKVLGKDYFLPEFRHVSWVIYEIKDEEARFRKEAEAKLNDQHRGQRMAP